MDKTDQLFIRACKSGNPRKRVQSVIRRFYLIAEENIENQQIVILLLDICERYRTVKLVDLVDRLHPTDMRYIKNDYYENLVDILISNIRLSKIDKFPGLTKAAIFRK